MLATIHGTLSSKQITRENDVPINYYQLTQRHPYSSALALSQIIGLPYNFDPNTYIFGDQLIIFLRLYTEPGTNLICEAHAAYAPPSVVSKAEPMREPIPVRNCFSDNLLPVYTFEGVLADSRCLITYCDHLHKNVVQNILVFHQRQPDLSYSTIEVELGPHMDIDNYNVGDFLRIAISITPHNGTASRDSTFVHYHCDPKRPPCLVPTPDWLKSPSCSDTIEV